MCRLFPYAKSIKQPAKGPVIYTDVGSFYVIRPTKLILLQSLVVEPETAGVPLQDLNLVLFPVAEHIEVSGEGVKLESLLDYQG